MISAPSLSGFASSHLAAPPLSGHLTGPSRPFGPDIPQPSELSLDIQGITCIISFMPSVRCTIFKLLADPTRRALLDLLRGGEKNAHELSDHFRTSQQAISLHLQALRRSRVVEVTKQGRYRRYRLRAEPIREVFDWSAKYKPFFDPFGHAWLFSKASEIQESDAKQKLKVHTRRRRR